ncbi:tetratricopeptide (TPR) repeat protein [Pseudomonas frederiksbergensis]|uniref:tetratricopeptide repeat protein n=1 Tax=Pseudomonas frederiksbergensis TaxID=104087 RepID=UPI003D1EFF06
MNQGLKKVKRVLQSFLCALACYVNVPGSPALAAPQVLKEIPASLLGDASRQNVFVLTGDADEAFHRLLIAPVQARNEEILLDTSKALPLIKSQYSSDLLDGFSVRVLKGQSGAMTVVNAQDEEVLVKQRFVEAGDYIALVTNEEANAVYNFNLLFAFNRNSKQFELKDVLLVTNNDSCDRSLVSVAELPAETFSSVTLASFDGFEALQKLQAALVGAPQGGYKKLMTVDSADLLDMALAAFRKGDNSSFKDVMGYALMGGGAHDTCSPESYIVGKYYYPQRPGWSNDLGFLLGEAGYHAESIELLNAVIANNPERTVAYLNLADSYWAVNDKERAVAAYKQYASRMSGAGKASKIPSRVAERSAGVPES